MSAWDTNGILNKEFNPKGLAFQKLDVSTIPQGLNLVLARDCIRAMISIEGGPVRIRVDGTNPTSSTGHYAAAGDGIILESEEDIKRFRAVKAGLVDSVLQVTFLI